MFWTDKESLTDASTPSIQTSSCLIISSSFLVHLAVKLVCWPLWIALQEARFSSRGKIGDWFGRRFARSLALYQLYPCRRGLVGILLFRLAFYIIGHFTANSLCLHIAVASNYSYGYPFLQLTAKKWQSLRLTAKSQADFLPFRVQSRLDTFFFTPSKETLELKHVQWGPDYWL